MVAYQLIHWGRYGEASVLAVSEHCFVPADYEHTTATGEVRLLLAIKLEPVLRTV